MKATERQFALSLYEAVDGKPAGQATTVIKKFAELLAEKKMLAKADKITSQFVKIWNENNKIVEAEIVSAYHLDKETAKFIKNYIVKLSGAEKVVLNEKNDKNILGGVIIKYDDKVFDGSLKTQLEELKNKLIK